MARRSIHDLGLSHKSNTVPNYTPPHHGGRDEQRHLLVELELDRTLIPPDQSHQHMQSWATRTDTYRREALGTTGVRQSPHYEEQVYHHPHHWSSSPKFETTQRPRSASQHPQRASSPLLAHQHSNRAKKLPSPYKLKQKIISNRAIQDTEAGFNSSSPHRRASRSSSTPTESPALLAAEGLRQNLLLRDQLVDQLKLEVRSTMASALILQPRVVKLLNKLRSLSLSIVEMVQYFLNVISSESGSMFETMENDFRAYLLHMSSSDVDFLACFPPLIRVFDGYGVSLSRNPFVDGLSLDSSELLLCSCHQMTATSNVNLSSSSSSSLFQLGLHKLDTFGIQIRKQLPTWQVLPAERLTHAMLYLLDLETRSNAVRLLPSYLQLPSSSLSASSHRAWAWGKQPSSNFFTSAPTLATVPIQEQYENPAAPSADMLFKLEAKSLTPRRTPISSTGLDDGATLNKNFVRTPSIDTLIDAYASTSDMTAQPREDGRIHSVDKLRSKKAGATKNNEHRCISPTIATATMDLKSEAKPVASLPTTFVLSCPSNAEDVKQNNTSEVMLEKVPDALACERECDAALADITVMQHVPLNDIEIPFLHVAKCAQETDSRMNGIGTTVDEVYAVSEASLFGSNVPSDATLPQMAQCDELKELTVTELAIAYKADDNIGDADMQGPSEVTSENESSVTLEDDFEYSSNEAIANIALALNILPCLSMDKPLLQQVNSAYESEQLPSNAGEDSVESTDHNQPILYASISTESGEATSVLLNTDPLTPFPSSRPTIKEECVADEVSDLDKIFSLCRDIQVTAYDMSHRFSEHTVDHTFETANSGLHHYLNFPRSEQLTNTSPRYLERELKMLRRNFRSWKMTYEARKQIKTKLRISCARRRIVCFFHYCQQQRRRQRQEREDYRRNVASVAIQQNWLVHKQFTWQTNLKANFLVTHLAFRRFQLFMRLQQRRRRREAAKERIHRWWRHSVARIRKKQKKLSKLREQQQQRTQAAKDIQRFLREVVLRKRLAAAMQLNQQIRFHGELRVTKAREEEVKRREKLEAAIEVDRKTLEMKWQAAEQEKQELLVLHTRMLEQTHQVDENRKRAFAALKVRSFMEIHLLRNKLHRTDQERLFHEQRQRMMVLVKEHVEQQAQLRKAKDKLELRVLLRKLHKAERTATQCNEEYEKELTKRQIQEQALRQQTARCGIKAFIDTQLLHQKHKHEHENALLLHQQLVREKQEQEAMAHQDLMEHQRLEAIAKRELEHRLMMAHEETMALADTQRKLMDEKRQETAQMTKICEQRRVELCKSKISSWLWQQIRIATERKLREREQTAASAALAVHSKRIEEIEKENESLRRLQAEVQISSQRKAKLMELQKRKAQMKIQMLANKRDCDVAKVKIAGFLSIHVSRHRMQRENELARQQLEAKYVKDIQMKTQIHSDFIRIVLETKCTAESIAAESIQQAQRSLHRLSNNLQHKAEHLKRIRQSSCARRIQHCWDRWYTKEQHRRQEVEKTRQQQCYKAAIAIQKCWRRWAEIRKKVQRQAHSQQRLYAIHRRVSARKIQSAWRRRQAAIHEQRRREIERRRIDIKHRVNARKIQGNWRNSLRKKEAKRQAQRHERLEFILHRSSSRKIQRTWRMRQTAKKESQRLIERQQKLECIYHRVNAKKIQKAWKRWVVIRKMEQYRAEQLKQLEIIHRRSSARKIQKAWRTWQISNREAQRLRQRQETLDAIHRGASARKIQSNWRTWRREEDERLQQRIHALQCHVCARRILRYWHKWHERQDERRRVQEVMTIQALWRGFRGRKLYTVRRGTLISEKEEAKLQRYEQALIRATQTIQRCWRQWRRNVIRAKRARIKAFEDEMIERAKGRERSQIKAVRHIAVTMIQARLRAYYTMVKHLESVKSKRHEEELQRVKKQKALELLRIILRRRVVELEMRRSQQEEYERELMRFARETTLQEWAERQLPFIYNFSVTSIMLYHQASVVLQRSYRSYRRNQQLCFAINRSFHNALSGNYEAEFCFYFAHARAWMKSNAVRSLCLRFDASMTRKLLLIFDLESHSMSELREALDEVVLDAFPIFQAAHATLNPDEITVIDVEEMELPHFCALTRKMGRIRSMHRRKQVSGTTVLTPSHSTPKNRGELTIFDAVESASVEDAIFLQQQGNNLAVLEPKTMRTALHALTFCSENYRFRLKMLEFLLENAGIDINAQDYNGDTPLMLYAAHGHLELMKKLLDYEADLKVTNNSGRNVLHLVCEKDQVEVCGFLQQLMASRSTSSTSLNIDDQTEALLLHVADNFGQYPLHILAEKGFVECAKQILLSKSVSTDTSRLLLSHWDQEGRTALHLAVLTNDLEMIALLLTEALGANVNGFDHLRRFPVHFAIDIPNALPILSMLAARGADLNVSDERGDTALHWAAFSGRSAVIQHLLTLGADPMIKNSDWETPAQIAASYGHVDCMRLLIEAQKLRALADRNAIDDSEERLQIRVPLAMDQYYTASANSYYISRPAASTVAGRGGVGKQSEYWEELHQEVQLVEESGHFSSEDEDNDTMDEE